MSLLNPQTGTETEVLSVHKKRNQRHTVRENVKGIQRAILDS
jgi:hypothetical protein